MTDNYYIYDKKFTFDSYLLCKETDFLSIIRQNRQSVFLKTSFDVITFFFQNTKCTSALLCKFVVFDKDSFISIFLQSFFHVTPYCCTTCPLCDNSKKRITRYNSIDGIIKYF